MADEQDKKDEGTAGPAIDAQLELVRSLACQTETVIQRVRNTQIPQQIGMAAAARALAADLPRVLAAQVQADLTSGALGKRWDALLVREGDTVEANAESVGLALAKLLVEQARGAARYVSTRAEEWAADAYRLEGQANALDEQSRQLARVHEGIAQSRASAQAQEVRQDERRRQRANGETPRGERTDSDPEAGGGT